MVSRVCRGDRGFLRRNLGSERLVWVMWDLCIVINENDAFI